MSAAEQWATNQRFLDEAIARGDTFRLATEVSEARADGSFMKELDYLAEQGFKVSEDGTRLALH